MKHCKQLNHHKWSWQVRETSVWANCEKCDAYILVPERTFKEIVDIGFTKGQENVRGLIKQAMGEQESWI